MVTLHYTICVTLFIYAKIMQSSSLGNHIGMQAHDYYSTYSSSPSQEKKSSDRCSWPLFVSRCTPDWETLNVSASK
jgi:hypothetical protein